MRSFSTQDMPTVAAISSLVKTDLLIQILFAVLQDDLNKLDQISTQNFMRCDASERNASACNRELDRLGWTFFRVESRKWSAGDCYYLTLTGHHQGDEDEPAVLQLLPGGAQATYGTSNVSGAHGVKNLRWVLLRQVAEPALAA